MLKNRHQYNWWWFFKHFQPTFALNILELRQGEWVKEEQTDNTTTCFLNIYQLTSVSPTPWQVVKIKSEQSLNSDGQKTKIVRFLYLEFGDSLKLSQCSYLV